MTTAEEACQCMRSHAFVTGFHSGHCCFFPATQTCHSAEIAEWEAVRDRLTAGVSPETNGEQK